MGIGEALAPLVSVVEQCSVVEGVAVVGSRASGRADAASDVDLFVYVHPERDAEVLTVRERLARELADPTRFVSIQQTGHPYADTWTLRDGGPELDLMFWTTTWAEEELDWRLVRHQRQLGGPSTAFWRSIRDGIVVFDRSGWVDALQERARAPFPEELRAEILAYDLDLLGTENPFSFLHQLDKAIKRGDHVAANNRSTQWLVCYFDALFAANRVLHPGEKRLLDFARRECASVPDGFEDDVIAVTRMAADLDAGAVDHLRGMLGRLAAIARD